jgi:FKBP-type peptidyl-prolyl cis-trans isomerase
MHRVPLPSHSKVKLTSSPIRPCQIYASARLAPSRRAFLLASAATAVASALPRLSNAALTLEGSNLGGLDEPAKAGEPKFVDVGSGLLVQEVALGAVDGLAVGPGTIVALKFVMRRSNGYFIDSTYSFEKIDADDYRFVVGTGAVVAGFEKAIEGMKPGGRRRFAVPPSLGYVAGGTTAKSPGPIPQDWGARRSLTSHVNEPILFEVLISKVRNAK